LTDAIARVGKISFPETFSFELDFATADADGFE
jgi:hypothetical protein